MYTERSRPVHRNNEMPGSRLFLRHVPRLLTVVLMLAIVALSPPSRPDVLVTKDGEIIHGKIIIRTDDTIVMRTDEGRKTLKLNELKDVPEDELWLLGQLVGARKLINTGETSLQLERFPDADKAFREAIATLAEITETKAGDKLDQRNSLISLAKSDLAKLNSVLDSKGLTLHKGFVFNAKALNKHLQEGHIIFAKKFWIHPSQPCGECSGKGATTCSFCKGTGSLPAASAIPFISA